MMNTAAPESPATVSPSPVSGAGRNAAPCPPPPPVWKLARVYPRISQRCYTVSKLLTDPLYDAVFTALRPAAALPLLDIGCGMGVLAFYLRARGWTAPVRGIDYDPRKIECALHAARVHGVNPGETGADTRFSAGDAREGLPEHAGNVTILDILQFFTPDERTALLRAAAERVAPGGRLVIRSGLADTGDAAPGARWRERFTLLGDRFAAWTFWMRDHPVCYPSAEALEKPLADAGLTGGLRPLWGRTPFNNWLGVWERKA